MYSKCLRKQQTVPTKKNNITEKDSFRNVMPEYNVVLMKGFPLPPKNSLVFVRLSPLHC